MEQTVSTEYKPTQEEVQKVLARIKQQRERQKNYQAKLVEKMEVDPEFKDKVISQRKAYNTSEKAVERRKEYYAKNKEKMLEYRKVYQQKQRAVMAQIREQAKAAGMTIDQFLEAQLAGQTA
jgi:hypothetical protein